MVPGWSIEVRPAEFEKYVISGRGFLSVHSGNAFPIDKDSKDYLNFVGNHFITHPQRCDVNVTPVGTHYITEGIDEFQIRDEHYEIKIVANDATTILETTSATRGTQGYVRNMGDGRLCVFPQVTYFRYGRIVILESCWHVP